jgi:hypothetical protein
MTVDSCSDRQPEPVGRETARRRGGTTPTGLPARGGSHGTVRQGTSQSSPSRDHGAIRHGADLVQSTPTCISSEVASRSALDLDAGPLEQLAISSAPLVMSCAPAARGVHAAGPDGTNWERADISEVLNRLASHWVEAKPPSAESEGGVLPRASRLSRSRSPRCRRGRRVPLRTHRRTSIEIWRAMVGRHLRSGTRVIQGVDYVSLRVTFGPRSSSNWNRARTRSPFAMAPRGSAPTPRSPLLLRRLTALSGKWNLA